MSVLPKALLEVIEAFNSLPGVGPRTAERYAYYLLKMDGSKSLKMSEALKKLPEGFAFCKETFALIEPGQEVSPLYSDPDRDKSTVMVVEDAIDIAAIEKMGTYKGTYHVLGGLLSPIDGITPQNLHIKELEKRVKRDGVKELIIALNASVEAESTALYLQKQFDGVEITRLARGLPVGLEIEYADQITLGEALERRQKV